MIDRTELEKLGNIFRIEFVTSLASYQSRLDVCFPFPFPFGDDRRRCSHCLSQYANFIFVAADESGNTDSLGASSFICINLGSVYVHTR